MILLFFFLSTVSGNKKSPSLLWVLPCFLHNVTTSPLVLLNTLIWLIATFLDWSRISLASQHFKSDSSREPDLLSVTAGSFVPIRFRVFGPNQGLKSSKGERSLQDQTGMCNKRYSLFKPDWFGDFVSCLNPEKGCEKAQSEQTGNSYGVPFVQFHSQKLTWIF